MRSWWQLHVEDRLAQLPVNWDMLFLMTSSVVAVLTVLSGGRFPM